MVRTDVNCLERFEVMWRCLPFVFCDSESRTEYADTRYAMHAHAGFTGLFNSLTGIGFWLPLYVHFELLALCLDRGLVGSVSVKLT